MNIPESHIHPCPNWDNVLVSAAVELIFFLAVSIVLCFGFRLEIMLITQGYFICCWAVLLESVGLGAFPPHPTREQAGGAQEAGRGHSQDSWPKLAKEIPHITCHHCQYITFGKAGRWQLLRTWSAGGEFSSQEFLRQCICIGHHLFYSISVHIIFPSHFCPTELYLSQPADFSLLWLLLLSTFSTLSKSERMAGWCLTTHPVKPWHTSIFFSRKKMLLEL